MVAFGVPYIFWGQNTKSTKKGSVKFDKPLHHPGETNTFTNSSLAAYIVRDHAKVTLDGSRD